MPDDSTYVITAVPAQARPKLPVKICEHKGIGHLDRICDGVAEAVSCALSLEYLRTDGQVLHHNVDRHCSSVGKVLRISAAAKFRWHRVS